MRILVFNYDVMENKIDIEEFKKAWFSFEEIESIKRWLDDVENGRVVPYNKVKALAREKIFHKEKKYA